MVVFVLSSPLAVKIFWSGHTQGRFWKCCISQHHRLCQRYRLLQSYILLFLH